MTDAPLAQVSTVSHVAIEVTDLETSIAFYRRVLGMRIMLNQRDESPAQIKGMVGDFVIEIAQLAGTGAGAKHATVRRGMPSLWLSLTTSDVAGAFERLRAAGIVDQTVPSTMGGATFFSFRDPDGYVIELIELPDGAPSLSRLVADRLDATRKAPAA